MRRKYALPLAIITILLFCWEVEFFVLDVLPHLKAQAASPDVVINEIAWMGTNTSPNDEWIELLNNSDGNIELTGWEILKDGKEFITISDSTAKSCVTTTILAHQYYLLESTDDNTVSDVGADFIYKGNLRLNNEGNKLELRDKEKNIIDQTPEITGSKWLEGDNDTRQTMERKDPQLEGSDPDNWQTSKNFGGTPRAANSIIDPEDTSPAIDYILINELLPNPKESDRDGEYIELFNNSDTTANISEWQLSDATSSTYTIGASTTMASYSYLAFYTGSKFLLNNNGDTAYLLRDNEILDEITYSGTVLENQSYNRKSDNTWAWSTTLTPNAPNKITQEKESSQNKIYPRHIWINEFLPDPEGKDTEGEFIELYNPGPNEINLENWQLDDLEDGGSRPYTFPEGSEIKAGNYLVLPYSETKIALNNNGDWVRLLWPQGQAIDEIEYEKALEGKSYNKRGDNWCWSKEPTPSEQNICSTEEPKEGNQNYPRSIWINEFLPDPEGKDKEGEFIEIQNRGDTEIDLSDWQLDDLEGDGSRPYIFPKDSKISPHSYLLLYYKDTKIALNNKGDWVRLINPAGQAIDEIKYGKAPKGKSYSRQSIYSWQWTENISPGKDNEFPGGETPPLQVLSETASQESPTLPQTGPGGRIYFILLGIIILSYYISKSVFLLP